MYEAYPSSAILIVMATGLTLAFARPYTAFLLAILLLTAGHVDMFNHTRMAALGPYFNLSDACMFVAAVAVFTDKYRKGEPVWLPQIVALMLLVVTIASVQSLWKFGGNYETLRAVRWAIQFPASFLLGANIVTSEDRGQKLVMVLLAGALLAALQHVLFAVSIWQTKSLSLSSYEKMRTIGFWAGCMPSAFLVATAIWTKRRGVAEAAFYVGAGLLLVGSLFLNQTRSLWIATVCSVPCLIIIFVRKGAIAAIVRVGVIGIFVICTLAWICGRIMPGLSVVSIATDRMERLFDGDQANVHVGTRERAFQAEMASWADGTLLFGRGLCFFQTARHSDDYSEVIAFNHLGYVTYLSQMGVMGLLVYGLYLPLNVLRNAIWLSLRSDVPSLHYLGIIGGASIICLSLMFVASSHFLGLGYEAPGVLYGGMWALVRVQQADSVSVAAEGNIPR